MFPPVSKLPHGQGVRSKAFREAIPSNKKERRTEVAIRSVQVRKRTYNENAIVVSSTIRSRDEGEMKTFDESRLQPARLFPITGIKGAIDQERRTASAFLAVLKVVPDLAYTLFSDVKVPKGSVETYIEPEFKIDKKSVRPDGYVVITRGKKVWKALLEVKTGTNDLDLNQINMYLGLCRDFKIDALITLSNQVINASGGHPTDGVDQRKLRSTQLEHISWLRVISESLVLSEHTGIEDIEQDYVLKELIRFLQSKESGASEFNDMSQAWAKVRDSIKIGAYRKPDQDVFEIVSRFESLMRYAAFTLSARIGVAAKESLPRLAKSDYKKHLASTGQKLIDMKTLAGELEIPGAASSLKLVADLGASNLHCSFDLGAPQDVRNKARVNWLVRQLKGGPDETLISWTYKRARSSEKPLRLSDLRQGLIDLDLDSAREISSFNVSLVGKMGTKRTAGSGSFIDSVIGLISTTYGELLQKVKPWQPAAPKLSESVRELIPEIEKQASDVN